MGEAVTVIRVDKDSSVITVRVDGGGLISYCNTEDAKRYKVGDEWSGKFLANPLRPGNRQ